MALVFLGAAIWIVDALFLSKSRDSEEKEPWLVDNAKQLTPVLAFVFILRSFLFEPFQIPSGSMERTLLVGDFILVNKYTYGIRLPVFRNKVMSISEPEQGDVMVFFPPDKEQYYIKRVVGVPGDLIEYNNKVLTINGVEQIQKDLKPREKHSLLRQKVEMLGDREHQIQQRIDAPAKSFRIRVPEGHYFMMGDNRDNSLDSRFFGPVPESRIVGKAVAIWMHKDPGFNMPTFSRVGSIQ